VRLRDHPKSGRPKKTTPQDDHSNTLHVLRNRKLSAPILQSELRRTRNVTVSAETVRRCVRAAGYSLMQMLAILSFGWPDLESSFTKPVGAYLSLSLTMHTEVCLGISIKGISSWKGSLVEWFLILHWLSYWGYRCLVHEQLWEMLSAISGHGEWNCCGFGMGAFWTVKLCMLIHNYSTNMPGEFYNKY